MLGVQDELTPRYLKRYASLSSIMEKGVREYLAEVKSGSFPAEEHSYPMAPGELKRLKDG
jgi:3-methyl-2-oxobutanoate hydroxymethyltransferase